MAQAAAVATVVSILGATYYTDKAHREEKKTIKQANKLAAEQTSIEREAQEANLKETERRNRNLLAKQQSAYKARLGASGLTSETGSGQVVLNTMQKETDMENKYEQKKTQYSLRTLNNRLKQTQSRNLLNLNKTRIAQQTNVLNAGARLGQLSD
ncbi:MAG: hypothetical protein II938_04800 [Alphaproteobacteria bacterium]|nr:hypothetical protein [Alphaproteobacteria bacterium]